MIKSKITVRVARSWTKFMFHELENFINVSQTFSEKHELSHEVYFFLINKRLISACRVKAEGVAQVYACRVKSEGVAQVLYGPADGLQVLIRVQQYA